ncbi:hypothetical protein PIROE2DRAFT_9934, partial [Piromyces sp. E2]
MSDLSIISLREHGVTDESSHKDDDGRIGDEIAIQEDILSLIKLLLEYKKNPSDPLAGKLHTLGSSYGSPIADLVEDELLKLSTL